MLLFCLAFIPNSNAQRQITDLESNSDMGMDSRPDSTSNNDPDFVPVDIRAWNIDERFGNIFETKVDTLSHLFQNSNHPEGVEGEYSTLGNVGSPRLSRIFMNRKPMSNFLFTDPFDMFFVDTDKFTFYNTKSPFMNVTYNWCGSNNTGDDHVKVIYTNNAGKRVNIGGIFDYIYGQGYYANQSTSFMNASAWASYLGDKYNFHFYYQHNFMKLSENGGITDEDYITNPEKMTTNYGSSDFPTHLSSTWNRQEHNIFYFNHHYNIGFYKTIAPVDTAGVVDSTKIQEVFVPVSKIFHTFKLNQMMRNYLSTNTPENYHSYSYLPGDSTNDRTKMFYMKNIVGLSLCEGFNKWAVFGINAYAGFEHSKYTIPDSLNRAGFQYAARLDNVSTTENNVLIGGQVIRSQGKFIRYNVNAEYMFGDSNGQFEIEGHAEANIPILGDTAKVFANAYIKNLQPSYYFRHYHSKNAWWDNDDADKEFRQRIEGVISIPHTKTKLTVGFENIKNFCYFKNTGTILNPESNAPIITNSISALQSKKAIQVATVSLRQDFALGILHFDNVVTYQHSSDQKVLPLPDLSTYHNLYIKFKIAKVLNTEMGADVKYFTEYEAPDYSPVMGQFMNQHDSKCIKIGNYPLISGYANFQLKRARFYVQYYHANQTTGRYFWAPFYPMNPSGVHFGLSWNFYD